MAQSVNRLKGTGEDKFFPRAYVALSVVTAIAYVAGLAMVLAWFALLMLGEPGRPAPGLQERTLASCSVCGVVERVGEFERARVQLSGDASEGFVVLFAALSGSLDKRAALAQQFYETSVQHDDGSIRIVRDAIAPQWKAGDRVRVMRGRIEAGSSLVARLP